jgi:hypothetical protein
VPHTDPVAAACRPSSPATGSRRHSAAGQEILHDGAAEEGKERRMVSATSKDGKNQAEADQHCDQQKHYQEWNFHRGPPSELWL